MQQCLNVSIAVTRSTESDDLFAEALVSLANQTGLNAEIIVLDQLPSQLMMELCEQLSTSRIGFNYEAIPTGGLSFSRNHAVLRSSHPILLFLDTDAVVHSEWAVALAEGLEYHQAGVVGSRILPRWHRTPLFLTRSCWIREQYSLLDWGSATIPVAKIIGAGFGIHKDRLGSEAYFDEKLGRRDNRLLGGEEIDLCRRAARRGVPVFYVGTAIVEHQILPERIRYAWILKRIYYAGVNRMLAAGGIQPTHRLSVWDYVLLPLVMPFYLLGVLTAWRFRS